MIIVFFLSVFIRVHPRPIQSFVFGSFPNIKSAFICTTYVQFLKFLLSKRHPPHPNRSAVFDPELRPKGAHDEALPLSFDPEALDGEGGGEGGGDSFWLRLCRAVTSVAKRF